MESHHRYAFEFCIQSCFKGVIQGGPGRAVPAGHDGTRGRESVRNLAAPEPFSPGGSREQWPGCGGDWERPRVHGGTTGGSSQQMAVLSSLGTQAALAHLEAQSPSCSLQTWRGGVWASSWVPALDELRLEPCAEQDWGRVQSQGREHSSRPRVSRRGPWAMLGKPSL